VALLIKCALDQGIEVTGLKVILNAPVKEVCIGLVEPVHQLGEFLWIQEDDLTPDLFHSARRHSPSFEASSHRALVHANLSYWNSAM
jgi:hypothetical protein